MAPLRVVVHGALGKVGIEVVKALSNDPELKLVGALERQISEPVLRLPGSGEAVPFSTDPDALLAAVRPDVLVDFSLAEATMRAVRAAARHNVNLVIGTTGLSPADVDEIGRLAGEANTGAVVAANFALGAIVMMHLGKIAARYFDYAEIIELHHEQKADAPSGTALATAGAMVESRGKPFQHPELRRETLKNARGGESGGVAIHSVRLPGFSAHQEIIFGAPGQTLTIRHDTINRECYIPGVVLAIRHVAHHKGLTYGLEPLLGL